jgi:hypothetical protein
MKITDKTEPDLVVLQVVEPPSSSSSPVVSRWARNLSAVGEAPLHLLCRVDGDMEKVREKDKERE